MDKLKKLFESFNNAGRITLNRQMEVCFEIDYKERNWNFAKVNYNDIEGLDINTVPKSWTKLEKNTHHTWFRYDEQNMVCKVLEWLSRPALKEGHKDTREWYLNGINKFLGTRFTHQDIEEIYCKLGNEVNRPLTLKFIDSGYDMEVLK